jgi:uncharacterized protein involved in exopolysaccharide biosynthesis
MNSPDQFEDAPLLDLRKIVATLFARRWWLVGATLAGAVIGGVIGFTTTPVFRGTAILAPVNLNQADGLGGALGQLGGLASVVGLNLGGSGTDAEEAMAVIRSREFSERFIVDHDLLPRFFPAKWDAANKKWKVPEEERPTLGRAFKYFDTKVRSISQDRKTHLVTLRIDWIDRKEAADWANELVNRLNVEMRARATANANASVTYLEKELEATNVVATRDAISRLVEAQVKQRMLANVTQEYAFRIVDRAMPADRDDKVKPHKAQLIAVFGLGGFFVAALWVLVSGSLRAGSPGRRENPV